MLWQGRRPSGNVEDNRGGGGGRRKPLAGGGLGTLLIVVLIYLFGGDTKDVLRVLGTQQSQTQAGPTMEA
jgi:predicted metalloprotease